ncbi:hypothetical protein AMTR_s00079p00111670 [Amborella trichopoda]|uniref:Aminotransferase-like plant mobile domain-containing protein n=1 Tax=Amborella trichopoda TaxID=13333 RepID=W1PAE0_AMBTC|nr:hypothetical protein AMTR_s00079p00111670 [Amborella trichopoda]
MIIFNITKYWMTDRVLRQFGKVQGIPVEPPKWDRRETIGIHPTSWIEELSRQISDWRQRERNVVKATVYKYGGIPTEEYITWYGFTTDIEISPCAPTHGHNHVYNPP